MMTLTAWISGSVIWMKEQMKKRTIEAIGSPSSETRNTRARPGQTLLVFGLPAIGSL